MTRFDPAFGVVFDEQPIRPTPLEKLGAYWKGTGSCTHRAVLGRIGATPEVGGPRYLIRVDDFPRWDRGVDGFLRFHSILQEAGIRYVLGVIPRPSVDPRGPARDDERELTEREIEVLRSVTPDVELALHGWSHRSRQGPIANEIVGTSAVELDRRLLAGLEMLGALGFASRSYIPPFNAVDEAAFEVLASRFEVVFGGPESVRWLGCRPGPSRIRDSWYLPSYPPAYGKAADVAAFVEKTRRVPSPILIPLTLHWAWDEEDDFGAVERLAALVGDQSVSLSKWLAGEAWEKSA